MPTLKKKSKKATNTRNAARAQRAKKSCQFQPFKLKKKDAFKMADLRKDKTTVSLKEANVLRLMGDFGYTEDHAKLKKALCARKFDINFVGDFYDPPGPNMLWELSCMYNDIVKIKEHLLEKQIQSLLASVGKGYIEIDDI